MSLLFNPADAKRAYSVSPFGTSQGGGRAMPTFLQHRPQPGARPTITPRSELMPNESNAMFPALNKMYAPQGR